MSYFITSVPKSGTHLVATIVQEVSGSYPRSLKKLPGKHAVYPEIEPEVSLVGHFRVTSIRRNPSLAKLFNERKVLLLVRDPRAICNSMLHHLMTSRNKYHTEGREQVAGLPFNEQIIRISRGLFASDGTNIVPDIEKMCMGVYEIRKLLPDTVRLRYEDFFNPKFVVRRLPDVFSIDAENAQKVVETALAGDSKTKRVGDPNGWRSVWDSDLTNYFNTTHGELIEKMGYTI